MASTGKISVSKLRFAYLAGDFFMTSLAFFLFNIIRYNIIHHGGFTDFTPVGYLTAPKMLLEQIFVPIGLLPVYILSGYYNKPFPRSRLHELALTAYCSGINSLIIFMIFLINDPTPKRRTEYLLIFLLFAILFSCTYACRLFITNSVINLVKRRKIKCRTLIVGNSAKSRQTKKELLRSHSYYSNEIVGFVPVSGESNMVDGEVTVPFESLEKFCDDKQINQFIISLETNSDKKILSLVDRLIGLNLPVKIAPDTLSYATSGIRMTDILGDPLVDLTQPRLGHFSSNLKRLFDVVSSSLVLLVLSPFLLIMGAVIKIESKGPAIYSQERIGKKRRPFRIYKFRSMRVDAESEGPQLSQTDDPRITRVGRFMRKYRIDELPQFFNVLKGDMSVVGPRPEREFFINQIVKLVPYYSLVYQVKPGITSWAMVKFGYASTVDQMVERTKYDMVYINNMSLMLDIKIMIYTVKTVISGAGV